MSFEVDILLAEDTSSDAEMTIRALRKNKNVNTIVHVRDGAAVLDFLFGTGEFVNRDILKTPKFILLDLKMPKLSGIEVLQQLRANALTKDIPVVVLTSSKEQSDIKKCYGFGVNSYIVKPVQFDEFMKVVSDLGLYWTLHNQT
jgi:two-component system response regulator